MNASPAAVAAAEKMWDTHTYLRYTGKCSCGDTWEPRHLPQAVADAVMAVASREVEEQLRHSLQQARSALGEMSRKYLEERSRVEAAEAKVAAVEALHLQDADGWCESDGFCWPCPTARALAISADSFSRVRGPIGP